MITQNDIARLTDADVYDTDGDKIGSVGQVYLDSQSGDPEWVSVKTGLFGTKETFVPLRQASVSDDRVTVGYPKSQVKDAPRIDADGPLSYADEDTLYQYYGLESSGAQQTGYTDDTLAGDSTQYDTRAGDSQYDTRAGDSQYGTRAGDSQYDTRSQAEGGRAGDSTQLGGDGSMTRSEERLVTGTRTEEAGKARLRKHVVTEQQQVDVPVSHEEVTLQREPITDANTGDAYAGADITESEHEVTLRAERPVVDTEVVPVERVRLGKETVNDSETVSGEVRKEQIEFDGPQGRDRN